MKTLILRNLAGLFMSLALGDAVAQTLPSAHIKIQRIEEVFQFKSSTELVTDVLLIREALSVQGAQTLTKMVKGVNSTLEKLELLDAYTLKKSGEKLHLAKDAIVVQHGYVSPGVGVTIPGWEAHQWTFPSVEVGDSTVIRYKTSAVKPPLPGWQSAADFLPPTIDFDKVVWRIEAPQDLAIHVKSSLTPDLSVTTTGLKVWQFETSQKSRVLDANPSSLRQALPYLLVSTVADARSIAEAFANEVLQKGRDTPEVKALALRLTADSHGDEQKAKALYDWVRKEIKYTALYLGNDGWQPHDVSHILEKRYGDCKDHVTLLYALLASAGIASQPVLINLENEYVADPIPVASSYGHTILYIPTLQRYLDPTATTMPFEALPTADSGKPVVRSDGRTATLDRVPVISAQGNTTKVKTKLTIAADGSVSGGFDVESTGAAATWLQDRLEQIPAGFSGAAIGKILEDSKLSGTGSIVFPKVDRDVQKQTARIEFAVKNFLRDPTGGSVQAHPRLNFPIYMANNLGNYTRDSREFSYPCRSMQIIEEFEVRYDPKFQLSRVPQDMNVSLDEVQFSAHYRLANNVLTGDRELLITHSSQECTPQEYQRRKSTMEKISKHLSASLLYVQ